MKIQNKQDVIRWLKRLREDHPLSVATAVRQHYTDQDALVRVYTDQIIKDRYTGMIEYLESDEVESCGQAPTTFQGDADVIDLLLKNVDSDDVWCLDHRAYEDRNQACQSAKEYDGK